MTNEEAISILAEHYAFANNGIIDIRESDNYVALSMAINALREQLARDKGFGDEAEGRLNAICTAQNIGYSDKLFLRELLCAYESEAEHENPKSLTLDELREMDGQPVYIVGLKFGELDYKGLTGWHIRHSQNLFVNYESTYFRANYWSTVVCLCDGDYGKTWIAYSHKPMQSNTEQ